MEPKEHIENGLKDLDPNELNENIIEDFLKDYKDQTIGIKNLLLQLTSKYFLNYDYENIKELFSDYLKPDEDENEDEPIIIYYDATEIHICKNEIKQLVFFKNITKSQKILNCSFKIFNKCIYDKSTRYTYMLNGTTFNTKTHLEIIKKAEPYLRKNSKGRDCMKEVIDYYDKIVPLTKSREFLGFDKGWVLPQTEAELGISIVTITDNQQIAYDSAKNILKDYTHKEKIKIIELVKLFIKETKPDTHNGAMLIGWSIASIFRLYFIRNHDLFPILYNHGVPNSGRSSLEDFWLIDFYGIYKDHLPASTTFARLEDHLSKSTFPISWQDLKEENLRFNNELISMLQDYSTSVGLFERKKSGKENDFIKYKIAPLNLDSNEILKMFSAPAINERQIFVGYDQKLKYNPKWTELRKKLRKYKLFSLVYDYTKDWTDEDIDKLYLKYLNEFTTEHDANSIRLLKSAAIIRFGLEIFRNVFFVNFKTKEREISNKDIIDLIIKGSSKMTEDVVDQFRGFCSNAIRLSVEKKTIQEHPNGYNASDGQNGVRINYINHKLIMDYTHEYYVYTRDHHQDFQNRCGKISMKTLADKLKKGLDLNEEKYIKYDRAARPFKVEYVLCKQRAVIKIYPGFLQDTDDIDVERMNYNTPEGD